METAKTLTRPDGARLYYRLWRPGERRPLIVLLHGMASNLTRWSEFLEHTSLKQQFDILRVDLRGHGESFTHARIGMDLWCSDLTAILDEEGYPNALWVGHSLGANVSLNMAAAQPSRVTGLVLIDPTFTDALRGHALWVRRFTFPIRLFIAGVRLLNRLGLYRRHVPTRNLHELDQHARQHLLASGKETEFVQRYTSPWADLKHFATANYLTEMLEVTRPIPPIVNTNLPMLALISKAVTFANIDETMTAFKRYPRATVTMLGAYHWPLTEKPLEVREAIENWCRKYPG